MHSVKTSSFKMYKTICIFRNNINIRYSISNVRHRHVEYLHFDNVFPIIRLLSPFTSAIHKGFMKPKYLVHL